MNSQRQTARPVDPDSPRGRRLTADLSAHLASVRARLDREAALQRQEQPTRKPA